MSDSELTDEAKMLTEAINAIEDGDDEGAIERINGVLDSLQGRGQYFEESLLEEARS